MSKSTALPPTREDQDIWQQVTRMPGHCCPTCKSPAQAMSGYEAALADKRDAYLMFCRESYRALARRGAVAWRTGLWREFARLIDECRPAYAIIENVAALRRRGLDVVLGDLSALG